MPDKLSASRPVTLDVPGTPLLVENPLRRFVALVLPDPGRRRLRFVFKLRDTLRAVAWMQVGADGSLYLNPRARPREAIIHASGIADGKGGFSELEVRETPIDELADPNPKVSHHASGIVTGPTSRSRTVSVRKLKEHTLIRQDQYAEPSRFEVVDPGALRSADIIVPTFGGGAFEIKEEHPLASRVFASPLRSGHAEVAMLDEDTVTEGETVIVIPYTNLTGCQDLTYELHFFPGQPGQWPNWSFSLVADLPTALSPGEACDSD